MRKILSILIVLSLAFVMASCNNESVSSQNKNSDYISSQTVNNETTSAESSTVSNQSNTTSKSDNSKQEKTSSNSTNTSAFNETSSTSSKNNSSATAPSENVTSKNTYKQPTDSDKNITVDSNGIVSITIPKWFLLKMEPDYDYKLTDKEKNEYKFISVEKTVDGSATYKIGYNDYHGFLLMSKSSVNAVVNKYKNNIWFTKTDVDAGYNSIKIYTKYISLEDFDSDFGVYIAATGLQTTFYQYMNYNYSVGTTITVYNKDNVTLATYNFPQLLQ